MMRGSRSALPGFGRWLAIVGLVVAAAIGGVMASSLVPALTGAQTSMQFYGCVNTFSGELRVVYSASQCTAGERPVNWSQYGHGGISEKGYITQYETVRTDDRLIVKDVVAACPDGYEALTGGAGYAALEGDDVWTLVTSAPSNNGDEWRASFHTLDGQPAEGRYRVFARVLCASFWQ